MTSVKIGPYIYKVQTDVPEDTDGFDKDLWGDVRHDLLRIRINKYANPQVSMVTLMHEILHCLGFMMGQQIDEGMIAQLSPLLIMALEDNGIKLAPWKKLLKEAGIR